MDAAAAHLLDFTKPFDCTLLDQILLIAMDGNNPQRQAANEFLVRIKEHPDMWKRVDAILESSTQLTTKIFGLQVLTETIETKWKIIIQEQREGIRNYIVSKIISLSSTSESLKTNNVYLARLNLVLIQILKQDWPHNWPTFISDIVMSSKASESLCENNMNILKLLSEEIFDYSKDSLTSNKVKNLKYSLNDEFSQIFTLCEYILQLSHKKSLILSTLKTLQRFLTWIPLGYIFETGLITAIITKFLPDPSYRCASIDCLTEIASLTCNDIPEQYHLSIQILLATFLQTLQTIVPIDVNLQKAYESSSDEDQLFIQRLALFLSTYLKSFFHLFDNAISNNNVNNNIKQNEIILLGCKYLVLISTIKDDEIFKTCLEFWYQFAKDLHTKQSKYIDKNNNGTYNNLSYLFYNNTNSYDKNYNNITLPWSIYDTILHELRIVMIDHMAKPEEVIIVEDENGEIVREMTKDTEVIAQYTTMRDSLIYLTHLNYDDTQAIMLEKLDLQVGYQQFTWNGLNTLCWAIGSISGAMNEVDEKRFLVSIIKDLLKLCEDVKGKDNKAVVASNIMYIVGQYPRFLRAHWKFLKTVVNKLFEFMHEYHPGVQDMACDTLLKISQKCKKKFLILQLDEVEPFILILINDLNKHIVDLQPHQIISFYESVSTMLNDNTVNSITTTSNNNTMIEITRKDILYKLLQTINNKFVYIINEGKNNINNLLNTTTINELIKIFKILNKVCISSGIIFIHELTLIYLDCINIYSFYSESIMNIIKSDGLLAVRWSLCKSIRVVKSEIIELLVNYFNVLHTSYSQLVNTNICNELIDLSMNYTLFIPNVISKILYDYTITNNQTKDFRILQLLTIVIKTLKELMNNYISTIVSGMLQPTLDLITTNMTDYPEHRYHFFILIKTIIEFNFYNLFNLSFDIIKLIIQSIIWAIKHTDRNISELGLEILNELLLKISNNNIVSINNLFYSSFLLLFIHEILSIMTDRLHKSGFKLQLTILNHLFLLIEKGQIHVLLSTNESNSNQSIEEQNKIYIKEHVTQLLVQAFPNQTKQHIITFVIGCFDINKDINLFKEHIRDFLISIKEFESEDNSDLYLDEKLATTELTNQLQWKYRSSIPGLLKPDEINDNDDYVGQD